MKLVYNYTRNNINIGFHHLLFLPKNLVSGFMFFLSTFAKAFCAGVILVDRYVTKKVKYTS